LLAIGLLPAQPVIAIKQTKVHPEKIRRLENTKFSGKCAETSSCRRTSHLKRIPIKRIPSTNRFPSWRAVFPAIPRLLSAFQKLLEEKSPSVFPSPVQLPLRRTFASASILHPAVGQFLEICPYFLALASFERNFGIIGTLKAGRKELVCHFALFFSEQFFLEKILLLVMQQVAMQSDPFL